MTYIQEKIDIYFAKNRLQLLQNIFCLTKYINTHTGPLTKPTTVYDGDVKQQAWSICFLYSFHHLFVLRCRSHNWLFSYKKLVRNFNSQETSVYYNHCFCVFPPLMTNGIMYIPISVFTRETMTSASVSTGLAHVGVCMRRGGPLCVSVCVYPAVCMWIDVENNVRCTMK